MDLSTLPTRTGKVQHKPPTNQIEPVEKIDNIDVLIVTSKSKNGAIGVILSTCASRRTFTGIGLKGIARNLVADHGATLGPLITYYGNRVKEVKPAVDSYYEEDRAFIAAVAGGDESATKSAIRPHQDSGGNNRGQPCLSREENHNHRKIAVQCLGVDNAWENSILLTVLNYFGTH